MRSAVRYGRHLVAGLLPARGGSSFSMKVLSILFGVLLALLPGGAQAARLALVIGINAYQNVPPLEKAVGDAEAMAARLSTLGFAVKKVIDPDRRTLNLAITTFRKSLRPGDDALVHFSGHGVEVDGNNLLLPADIPMPTEGDSDFLRNEAIDLSDLMRRIAGQRGIDADLHHRRLPGQSVRPGRHPGHRGHPGAGGRAGTEGKLRALLRRQGTDGARHAWPGDSVPTSVYTRILIESLGQPGISLNDLAKVVRSRVSALAGRGRARAAAGLQRRTRGRLLLHRAGRRGTGSAPRPRAASPPTPTRRISPRPGRSTRSRRGRRSCSITRPATTQTSPRQRWPNSNRSRRCRRARTWTRAPRSLHPRRQARRPSANVLALYGRLDFYGADIFKGHTTDAVQCAATCQQSSQCVAFTFNANPKIVTGPNCFLKDGLGRLDLYPDAFSGMFISSNDGPAPTFEVGVIDPKSDLRADRDIQGNDLSSRPLAGADTVDKCRVGCLEEQSCRAFSFAKRQKQCWLKDSGTPLVYSSGITSAVKRWETMPPSEIIFLDE